MLDRLHYLDFPSLQTFILSCQDPTDGGFSDRPGDTADVFHTLFGIAGLSLLGYEQLADVDAKFCMPKRLID